MTQKPFGVKQLNVIGAAGTPTIESAGDLNIGGQQVAITTNTSIAGVITATAFVGDGSNLTNISASVPANLTATTLSVSGVSTFQSHVHLGDDDELRFGAGDDFKIVHDPNDCRFENSNGDIKFKNTGSYFFFDENGGETLASFINDGGVNLYHDGNKKLETTGDGVSITGVCTATSFVGDGANITGISTSNITNYSGGGGGGGIALTDLSVSTASAGTAALSYNNSNGVFSYTPPDLSGFAANTNVSNWDTAYGWGNHASAGYLTSVNQNFSGIVTATSFQGNTTTGDGSDRGFTTKYYITSSGASAYRFAGPGVLNSTNNPTLYFHRGFTYILENSTGGSHPFALRVTSGGSNYSPGGNFLTGSTTGTQILTVPFDGPSSIVYQCTIHGGMLGTINFVS